MLSFVLFLAGIAAAIPGFAFFFAKKLLPCWAFLTAANGLCASSEAVNHAWWLLAFNAVVAVVCGYRLDRVVADRRET